MNKQKLEPKKGKKKSDKKDEPKVAFNGTFEDLIDIVAPPIKPNKKKG